MSGRPQRLGNCRRNASRHESRDTSHYSPLTTHLSLLEAKPKDAGKIYYPISAGVTLLRERLRFGSTGTTRSTPSRPG
jgi:hypothetical protein